jgi:hypothetical protein
MSDFNLSYRARKALMVHVGEEAGAEIADLITRLTNEVVELRRTKVEITHIVPSSKPVNAFARDSA